MPTTEKRISEARRGAGRRGGARWTVVDMKKDWKRIFALIRQRDATDYTISGASRKRREPNRIQRRGI